MIALVTLRSIIKGAELSYAQMSWVWTNHLCVQEQSWRMHNVTL